MRVAPTLPVLLLLGACEQPREDLPDAHRIRRDAAIDALSLDAALDAGPPPACPPMRPFGTEVGDVLGTFTVYDCAGTPFQIESLCETEVVWIWELAEWCAACRYFASDEYDDIYTHFEDTYGDRFAGVAIITADSELNLPNEEICRELRDRYGIEAPIYFDPTGTFRDRLGGFSNDVHAILTRGMRIQWTMQFGGQFAQQRLQETFDALDSGAAIPDANVSLDAGPLDDVTSSPDAP